MRGGQCALTISILHEKGVWRSEISYLDFKNFLGVSKGKKTKNGSKKLTLTMTRSDILQGQALFRGVKLWLTRGVW